MPPTRLALSPFQVSSPTVSPVIHTKGFAVHFYSSEPCTCYSSCLEHLSLSFVIKSLPQHGSQLSGPCSGSPSSRPWLLLPEIIGGLLPQPLAPAALGVFSVCGPQHAPGSGWPGLCQHPAAFATRLSGTRYVPGTGLGSSDIGLGQTGVPQPLQGLQPGGEDGTMPWAESCGGARQGAGNAPKRNTYPGLGTCSRALWSKK